MRSFAQVYACLRRKSLGQYRLLAGCCFFSVLLITAYATMMRAPTVLQVLPEGGDSRKQVMMIFVLACLGCAVFTIYASSLFFRQKSREIGVYLLLGTERKQLYSLLFADLARISLGSCAAGALLGGPLAWLIWRLFRLLVVDSEEMALVFDPAAYGLALAFSVFVTAMLFLMGERFLHRTNIIDVVYQSHKTEPIRAVPAWYGPGGIFLAVAGGLFGYLMPSVFILVLHWYPPAIVSGICYVPLFVGLYMILLHTVVNGWRRGKGRYKHIITTSMMKFQGRQTVRNMLVITLLIAGAYFASFYTPMLGTGMLITAAQRPIDYLYAYRGDQDMITKDEVYQMAQAQGVTITWWQEAQAAELGVDGIAAIESETPFGTTYETQYVEMLASECFLSESMYGALTGEQITVPRGGIRPVFDDTGDSQNRVDGDVSRVTNLVTGEVLAVTPESPLSYTMLLGYYVLSDADYAAITQGLNRPAWFQKIVAFNVEDCQATYGFAKTLFEAIVDHSGPEVAVWDGYSIGAERYYESIGEEYFLSPESESIDPVSYEMRDTSEFRMHWKYMPQFRVLDQNDFVRTMSVYLMLFLFIAIICFAAVMVIAYTRCLTIAVVNRPLYEDLRRLGADRAYLFGTVRGQVSRVFVAPCLVGTAGMFGLYGMIMYFNDSRWTAQELAGMGICLVVVLVCSVMLYGVYRYARRKVCSILGI